MTEQSNSTALLQTCVIGDLCVVYYIKQFEHCTVDALGEPDQLVQREADDSDLGDPPYYCRQCGVELEDWPSAKVYVEPES